VSVREEALLAGLIGGVQAGGSLGKRASVDALGPAPTDTRRTRHDHEGSKNPPFEVSTIHSKIS
jgi:hypothetical protein